MKARPRVIPAASAARPVAPEDHAYVVRERRLLVRDGTPLLRVADVGAVTEWVPLGTLDGTPVWAGTDVDVPDGEWRGWAALAGSLTEPMAALAGRALQVMTWRAGHRFCGRCAAELSDVPGEHARRCPSCGLFVPMQLSPAVLVAVRRGAPAPARDELLLVRHSYGATGIWALVAGFVEAGESLEDAARREVGEEVGLDLRDVTYFGSQPWAMSGPGVVLAGFSARCADASAEPVVDGRELTEARWFPLDALPEPLPPAYSISRWLIDAAAAGPGGVPPAA